MVPPPYEPTGTLHPIYAFTRFKYWSPCYILYNCCLLYPHILTYQPKPRGLQCHTHKGPLSFPAVTLPSCHPRNPSSDPVTQSLYHPIIASINTHIFLPYRSTTWTTALYILSRSLISDPISPSTFLPSPISSEISSGCFKSFPVNIIVCDYVP